ASYQQSLKLDPNLAEAQNALTHLQGVVAEESLALSVGVKEERTERAERGDEKPKDEKPKIELSPEERNKKINEFRDKREAHLKKKEWDKALDCHDKIIELDPTPLRYVNRG